MANLKAVFATVAKQEQCIKKLFDENIKLCKESSELRKKTSGLRAELVSLSNFIDTSSSSYSSGKKPASTPPPPRKVAHNSRNNPLCSLSDCEMTCDNDFPELPSTSADASRVGQFSVPLPVVNRPASKLVSSTSNLPLRLTIEGSASGSTNSSPINGAGVAGNRDKKPWKIVFQAIDTNIFDVQKPLATANIKSFSVKQTTTKGPVNITVSNSDEVSATGTTMANAHVSYHDFKWSDVKSKYFVIRGFVVATEADLPIIKHCSLSTYHRSHAGSSRVGALYPR